VRAVLGGMLPPATPSRAARLFRKMVELRWCVPPAPDAREEGDRVGRVDVVARAKEVPSVLGQGAPQGPHGAHVHVGLAVARRRRGGSAGGGSGQGCGVRCSGGSVA